MIKTVSGIIILIVVITTVWFYNNRSETNMNTGDNNTETNLKLISPAFPDGEFIGAKYTCDELNISPPLQISGVPAEAKSLVLIMDDPDVPTQARPEGVFDH